MKNIIRIFVSLILVLSLCFTFIGCNPKDSVPKKLKILAIGNSFSIDAMQYLWNICKEGGVEEIVLGNLYIASCTLERHWVNMDLDTPIYSYYENTTGEWVETKKTAISTAMEKYDWDIITLQQASGSSGDTTTFSYLDPILGYLEENKPKEDTEIWWHMTWAYQGNSTHSSFPKYENNQMTMYNKIVYAVNTKVLVEDSIKGVIPSGTAIQNLRTSYIGDTVTRDGYHMSYDIGRYTLALTWYATLTGGDIDKIDWVPESYKNVSEHFEPIRESVKNALKNKYEVTNSVFVNND